LLTCGATTVRAQEQFYFVTYDDSLEKPGEMELEVLSTVGHPENGSAGYAAPWIEFEYGVRSWWTSEVYLEGVSIHGEGSAFTGWRWENRFRPFGNQHVINPVLYVEYEDINEASRIQKEIVGSGPLPQEPLASLVEGHNHELEGRLILSSRFGAWNVSENVLVEKNFSAAEGVEFGYSAGVSRRLGRGGTESCRFCPAAFVVGAEAYGGLGATEAGGLSDTRQFIAPIVGWHPTHGSLIKASIGFGMTNVSDGYLLRVGYSVELR
jgi:hypothetical protein